MVCGFWAGTCFLIRYVVFISIYIYMYFFTAVCIHFFCCCFAVAVLIPKTNGGETEVASMGWTGQSSGQCAGKSGGRHQWNDRVGTHTLKLWCLYAVIRKDTLFLPQLEQDKVLRSVQRRQVFQVTISGSRRQVFQVIISGFKHIKVSKERCLLGQNTTCKFSG